MNDVVEDKRTKAAGRQQSKAEAAMAMGKQAGPERGQIEQRGWYGETAPRHDKEIENQRMGLGLAGSENGEIKEGSMTIGIDVGSKFI